jgi:hypothetical protein
MTKRVKPARTALTTDEREGIVLAVNSAFRKLKNLYVKIVPIFEDFGFTPPSAGVIAGDLSEKIEKAIIQHWESFTKGTGHCDPCRFNQDWEVKICKDSGLTTNQSTVIDGENYIVVNYNANSLVKSIWVLWGAQYGFFSPSRSEWSRPLRPSAPRWTAENRQFVNGSKPAISVRPSPVSSTSGPSRCANRSGLWCAS